MQFLQKYNSGSNINFTAINFKNPQQKNEAMQNFHSYISSVRNNLGEDIVRKNIDALTDMFNKKIEMQAAIIYKKNNLDFNTVYNILMEKFKNALTILPKLNESSKELFKKLCESIVFLDSDKPIDIKEQFKAFQKNYKNQYFPQTTNNNTGVKKEYQNSDQSIICSHPDIISTIVIDKNGENKSLIQEEKQIESIVKKRNNKAQESEQKNPIADKKLSEEAYNNSLPEDNQKAEIKTTDKQNEIVINQKTIKYYLSSDEIILLKRYISKFISKSDDNSKENIVYIIEKAIKKQAYEIATDKKISETEVYKSLKRSFRIALMSILKTDKDEFAEELFKKIQYENNNTKINKNNTNK